MFASFPSVGRKRNLPKLWLTGWLVFACLASANDTKADDVSPEHTRLAAVIRQIEVLERMVAQSAVRVSIGPDRRYHFDYSRLKVDLARLRVGIQAYLTPSRAQPRDPSELVGDYRAERAAEPLPATTAEGKP
jgi:RAQPRD family integrative conjugative element protein